MSYQHSPVESYNMHIHKHPYDTHIYMTINSSIYTYIYAHVRTFIHMHIYIYIIINSSICHTYIYAHVHSYTQTLISISANSSLARTFHFVRGSGPHFSFTILQKTLEGWHQVALCDLRTHRLLQLLIQSVQMAVKT